MRLSPTSSDPITDERLLKALERGESGAATRLYDRLIRVVEAALYRVLGARDRDHEDLVQQAMEQVLRTLVEKRFSRSCSLSTWASTITCNVALNALRSRRRERQVLAVDQEVEPETCSSREGWNAETQLLAREQVSQLRAHLSKMDPGKAETLIAHDVLGHDLAEIAVITGVSLAAAQSRLVRGRKELERRMSQTIVREGGSQ